MQEHAFHMPSEKKPEQLPAQPYDYETKSKPVLAYLSHPVGGRTYSVVTYRHDIEDDRWYWKTEDSEGWTIEESSIQFWSEIKEPTQ